MRTPFMKASCSPLLPWACGHAPAQVITLLGPLGPCLRSSQVLNQRGTDAHCTLHMIMPSAHRIDTCTSRPHRFHNLNY